MQMINTGKCIRTQAIIQIKELTPHITDGQDTRLRVRRPAVYLWTNTSEPLSVISTSVLNMYFF